MEKSLKELAALIGAEVIGDGSIRISGVAGIETAREGQITFIANPKYLSRASDDQRLGNHLQP